MKQGSDPSDLDLYGFFSTSCYSDFSDSDSRSFYNVYRALFERLDQLEQEAERESAGREEREPQKRVSDSF